MIYCSFRLNRTLSEFLSVERCFKQEVKPLNSNIPAYGQSLITMTQLKAVTSYEYDESDYYVDEYYETEYDYEGQGFERSEISGKTFVQ